MPREMAYTYVTEGEKNKDPPVIRGNLNAFKQIPGRELLLEGSSAGLGAVSSQI